MSESLSNLEVEPEWYSSAVLCSISGMSEPIDAPARESIPQPVTDPVPEELAPNPPAAEAAPNIEAVATKPLRSTPKSRSEKKSSAPKKSSPSAGIQRLTTALRSRQVRVVATAVAVLFVCGLIVRNWSSSPKGAGDEIADMDLSEFNDATGFDEPRISKSSEPHSLGVISDAEPMPAMDRFPTSESRPRLPNSGFVSHADHASFRGRSATDVTPASATDSGSRGAVLTGQIEFESTSRSADVSARPFRNFGAR